jgi:hypothetical protein
MPRPPRYCVASRHMLYEHYMAISIFNVFLSVFSVLNCLELWSIWTRNHHTLQICKDTSEEPASETSAPLYLSTRRYITETRHLVIISTLPIIFMCGSRGTTSPLPFHITATRLQNQHNAGLRVTADRFKSKWNSHKKLSTNPNRTFHQTVQLLTRNIPTEIPSPLRGEFPRHIS